jgi:hypothetical protein
MGEALKEKLLPIFCAEEKKTYFCKCYRKRDAEMKL